MGNILYVRVSASTFKEEDVKKYYPCLHALAWNKEDKYIPASQRYGLLELIATIKDVLDFTPLDAEIKGIIEKDWPLIVDAKEELNQEILDWQAHKANELTFKIEEMLTQVEKNLQADKKIKQNILKGEYNVK